MTGKNKPGNETVTIVANDVGGVGGMERQLQALITRLLTRGTHVVVVSRTLDLPPHAHLTWHRVPGPARPFTIAHPWFVLVASLMLATRRKGVLQTTGAIVLNRADVCTVHYLHTGHSELPARVQRSTTLYRLNAAVAKRMSRALERLAYGSATLTRMLVAVSAPIEADLLEQFPTRAASVRLIRNGVDTERFRPDSRVRDDLRRALGIAEGTPLALFVGSEWRSKGAELAVEALVEAEPWHLVVVGQGDGEALMQAAGQLGVRSRVQVVGELPDPERYYAAADAFVLPSAYESFSLAAFEAASSGLPVIATDVGAVAEIMAAGGGILVKRSASSVSAALRSLEARTEDEVQAMSERARAVALRFDWDAVVDQYVALYQAAAPGRHAVEAGRTIQ